MVLNLTCLLGSGGFNPLATAAPPPDRFLELDLIENAHHQIIKRSTFFCNKIGTFGNTKLVCKTNSRGLWCGPEILWKESFRSVKAVTMIFCCNEHTHFWQRSLLTWRPRLPRSPAGLAAAWSAQASRRLSWTRGIGRDTSHQDSASTEGVWLGPEKLKGKDSKEQVPI